MISNKDGGVIWVTGLPGAGKTTIGLEIVSILRKERKIKPIFLDGDLLRAGVNSDLGFGSADRFENARRVSELCKFLSTQNQIVICCTVSLYPEILKSNYKNIKNFNLVYLEVSSDILLSQNKKTYDYLKGKKSISSDKIIDDYLIKNKYILPSKTDFTFKNNRKIEPSMLAIRILNEIME